MKKHKEEINCFWCRSRWFQFNFNSFLKKINHCSYFHDKYHNIYFNPYPVHTKYFLKFSQFLPPGIADSLPAGHRAGTKCDDCSSYSVRWCLSTMGRSDEWRSSAPKSCKPAPRCLHHSPPEDEDSRRSLVEQVSPFILRVKYSGSFYLIGIFAQWEINDTNHEFAVFEKWNFG